MGDAVGVFDENEVAHLTPQQREEQKRRVLELLQNNKEIRDIISQDPRILTREPKIKAIIKRELRKP
jgi:hypothetical protein